MPREAQLRIPKESYGGFAKLLQLTPEQLHEFLAALRSTVPTFSTARFSARVADSVSFAADDVREMVDVLTSLHYIRAEMDLALEDFVDVVCDALADVEDDAIPKPNDGDWQGVRNRLTLVLGVETLGVVAKANVLWFQQDHSFADTQILTDLRPVFGPNPEEAPAAAMIVHQLRIEYIEGLARKEFFVAMNVADLQRLRATLDRAERKEESMRSLLKAASVPLLAEETE